MQITSNYTTIELDEEKLLALICDPRINALEMILSKRFKCAFINVPKIGLFTQIYLCRVLLDLSATRIAETYEMTESKINSIIKVCHASLMVDDNYHSWLKSIHTEYELNLKNAA